ncbi:MAG: hypothetical protein MI824_11525 [Hyphomicrobiales bacterium]|nr:hypothetical protein [Hyphomicrobiales bacterium]
MRPISHRIMTVLAVAAVAGATAWLVPASATSDWQTARTAKYDLHYGPGREADAGLVKEFLDTAHAKIAEEFQAHRPTELLDGIQLDIYLHPKPGEMASEHQATMTSNLRREGYKAAIHLLTPSSYRMASAGGSRDAKKDYVFRKVVHEVSAVYVQRLILGKPKGWRYDQAAPWFLQGYDEYLSGIHSRRAQDRTLERYRKLIRQNPGRVRFEGSIQVRDPYRDGAVLVAFLHDSFGREAVQNIWLSPEDTFEKALTSALRTDYADLETRWRRWLDQTETRRSAGPGLQTEPDAPWTRR